MNKIVSLNAYKTLKECQKLFVGYRKRLYEMDKADLLVEMDRYQKEANRYPHHLLTIVKGEILMHAIKERSLTAELHSYAAQEERRIKIEMYRRLQGEATK